MFRILPASLFVIVLILDQLSKFAIVQHWTEQKYALGQMISLIPGWIQLTLVYNTGAAWSMFSGAALPLAILRLLVGLGIMVYLLRTPQTVSYRIALSLIAAGAVGNALDGIRLGKVVDMIYSDTLSLVTQKINNTYFPIFNIADSAVVGGVILLIILNMLPEKKKTAPSSEAV